MSDMVPDRQLSQMVRNSATVMPVAMDGALALGLVTIQRLAGCATQGHTACTAWSVSTFWHRSRRERESVAAAFEIRITQTAAEP